jgi:hypothetical protein
VRVIAAALALVALSACSSPAETTADCQSQLRFEVYFADSPSTSDIERISGELSGS